jgi:hypothetical protein
MKQLTEFLKSLFNYNERRRRLDLEIILWPACCLYSEDLDHAKAAFARHTFHDEAWLSLGREEIKHHIDNLKMV